MANNTIKINFRKRSRNGNMRNKFIIIYTAKEPISAHQQDKMSKHMENFMASDRQIALLELPPNSTYSLIKL